MQQAEIDHYAKLGYVRPDHAAAMAREQLWRDVTGWLAYHAFMLIPTGIGLRWFKWLLPHVGDCTERAARWTFALEDAARPSSSEKGGEG
jgi:hypothetical protein